MKKSLFALVMMVAACSSSNAPAIDAAVQHDARPIDAAAGTPLTVKNYLNWCSVSVNGGAASSLDVQTVGVTTPGAIALTAVAASATFKIDVKMWHHTDGDTGTGDTGTVTGTGAAAKSATTVMVAATAKCVWVCCPFTNGTGCPATDQCP